MENIVTKDIADLTDDEIQSLNLPEYIKLEQLNGYDNNYMFMPPTRPQPDNIFYPVIVTANMHINHIHDKSSPFKTMQECNAYCKRMNHKLGHTDRSMFMLLESIRLEMLLRKKLQQSGELKIKSDYIIRESAGFKYILYDKGNGILTAASINEALNTGLAAIEREKKVVEKKVKEESKSKSMKMYSHVKRDWPW
jgi:hypothetical protein